MPGRGPPPRPKPPLPNPFGVSPGAGRGIALLRQVSKALRGVEVPWIGIWGEGIRREGENRGRGGGWDVAGNRSPRWCSPIQSPEGAGGGGGYGLVASYGTLFGETVVVALLSLRGGVSIVCCEEREGRGNNGLRPGPWSESLALGVAEGWAPACEGGS